MTEFVFKKLPFDLGSQAGVALVGKALRQININAMVDTAFSHPDASESAGQPLTPKATTSRRSATRLWDDTLCDLD